ncbi:MAG: glyoxalase [Acidobacteria bacterium]|nr:MAG: glyoxalase [Acidobacteriota bacterium]
MAEKAKPVPDGFHTLTPHLTVRDAEKAIDFYQKAFGAEVRGKNHAPDGKKIIHASLKIGDSMLMLNDEFPEWGTVAPSATGGTGIAIHVYVDNVDTIFDRAVSAGATVKMPLMDAFWGDRYGQIVDPFGHKWSLATHVRDMTQEEMRKEQEAAFAHMPKSA